MTTGPAATAATTAAKRQLTLSLTTVGGAVERFFAFIDGARVISAAGNTSPKRTISVTTSPVRLAVRVWGIGAAQYRLDIDLPGTADDQHLTLALFEGYHELELTL